jgi:hypothetical protein
MADQQVVVDADVSGFSRALRTASLQADHFGRSIKGAGRESARAERQLNRFADEAERMNRVSMILGGTFGDVTGGLDDFATLLKGGAGAVTALGAAAVIAAASVAALGTHIVSVAADASTYAAALDDLDASRWSEQTTAALGAEEALAELMSQMQTTSLVLAGEFGPAITAVADTITGATLNVRQYFDVLDTGVDILSVAFPLTTQLTSALRLQGRVAREIRSDWSELSEEVDEYAAMVEKLRVERLEAEQGTVEERAAVFEMEVEFLLANRRLEEERERERERIATKRSREEEKAHRDRMARLHLELEAELRAQGEYREFYFGTLPSATQAAGDAVREFQDTYRADAEVATEAVSEAYRLSFSEQIGLASQASDFLIGSIRSISEISQKEGRAAAKQRLAVSVIEAVAAVALGVANSLALGPPAGPIAAAITAAAGAVQVATVTAQANKLHRGGALAPDEAMLGATTVLRDERSVMLTREGQRAIGGEDGLAKVNAGIQAPTSDGATFIIDGVKQMARRLAAPDPGYGQWSPA